MGNDIVASNFVSCVDNTGFSGRTEKTVKNTALNNVSFVY
jgi:hypothetical protein